MRGSSLSPIYRWKTVVDSPGGRGHVRVGTAFYEGKEIFVKEWSLGTGISAGSELYVSQEFGRQFKSPLFLPDHVFTSSAAGKVALGVEKITGRPLGSLSHDQIIQTYRRIFHSWPRLVANSHSVLPRKSPTFIWLSFPYLFCKALIASHSHYSLLFQSAFAFYLQSWALLGSPLTFIHRDLGTDNIILKGRRIFLLDFQYAAYSVSEYEYVGIWRSLARGEDKTLSERFLREIVYANCLTKVSRARFKSLGLYYAILGLTDHRHGERRIDDFYYCLRRLNQ